MKIVKEKLNEDSQKRQMGHEKVQDAGVDIIAHLRSKVLPKLDQDELIDFMENLRDWIDHMIGEKEKPVSSSKWREAPKGPRGDMDSESWGDTPDWRDTGEMGG